MSDKAKTPQPQPQPSHPSQPHHQRINETEANYTPPTDKKPDSTPPDND